MADAPAQKPSWDWDPWAWSAVGVVALGAASAGFMVGMKRPLRSKTPLAQAMREGGKQAAAAAEAAAGPPVDPVGLARKALIYGTGIAVAGGAVTTGAVCWAMGITSFKEFGDRARRWTPGARESVQDSLGLVWREYDDEKEMGELQELFETEAARIEAEAKAAERAREASGKVRHKGVRDIVMEWWESREAAKAASGDSGDSGDSTDSTVSAISTDEALAGVGAPSVPSKSD